MSRIGKQPIEIPKGVEVKLDGLNINVKGPKGELGFKIHPSMSLTQQDSILTVVPKEKKDNFYGLTRSLVNNMVLGVSKGFTKSLSLVGVGYRAALKGKQLNLQLGYSHDIDFDIPEGIKISVEKQTTLKISGSDKQLVGSVVSKIKTFRKIEPYKGKGIREKGQHVLKKEGKKK